MTWGALTVDSDDDDIIVDWPGFNTDVLRVSVFLEAFLCLF